MSHIAYSTVVAPRGERIEANPALWARLAAYSLDKPGAELTFSKRLARENGWTEDYTRRVIEEYKRFCYLACVSPREVTPSDEVDQAWHLHLSYTREYWEEFCVKVLGRPLHHTPSIGGEKELERFRANYAHTLYLYRRVFDQEPPSDIWLPEGLRFSWPASYARVNLRLFSLKAKARLKPGNTESQASIGDWILQLAFLIIFSIVLSGIASQISLSRLMRGDFFELVFALLFLFFILFGFLPLLLDAVILPVGALIKKIRSARRPDVAWNPKAPRRITFNHHGFTVTLALGAGAVAGAALLDSDAAHSVEVSGEQCGPDADGADGDGGCDGDGGDGGCGGCGGCGD